MSCSVRPKLQFTTIKNGLFFIFQVRNARGGPFIQHMRRAYEPIVLLSLEERLKEQNVKLYDSERYMKNNIGFSIPKSQMSNIERKKIITNLKSDIELERKAREGTLSVDIDVIESDWKTVIKPLHLKKLAESYDVYKHLFGEFAYFYPVTAMNIFYDYKEDGSTVTPVYFGNLIKPKEAKSAPSVTFESKSDDLWTLILTNPDGNLYDNESEMLHWFIGNIPGGEIEKGEVIVDYLPPLPPKGTGFHRFIFILYKQNEKIDFSNYQLPVSCKALKKRTFRTEDFYRKFEDVITPAGLSWFQADYDKSLTNYFHDVLGMKEPSYKYEFPKAYIAPQKLNPHLKPFNRYLDLHRDPKETQKLMLLKRLKNVHPFKEEKPLYPFPRMLPKEPNMPPWLENEIRAERDGWAKYRDMYRGDDRPNISCKTQKSFPRQPYIKR